MFSSLHSLSWNSPHTADSKSLRDQDLSGQGLERRQRLVVVGHHLVVLDFVFEERAEVTEQSQEIYAPDPVARNRRLEGQRRLWNDCASIKLQEVLVGPRLQERILQPKVKC